MAPDIPVSLFSCNDVLTYYRTDLLNLLCCASRIFSIHNQNFQFSIEKTRIRPCKPKNEGSKGPILTQPFSYIFNNEITWVLILYSPKFYREAP